RIRRAIASLSGHRDDHQVQVAVTGVQDSVRMGARGGWVDGAWQGRLSNLVLESQSLGTWTLDSTGASLLASPARVRVRGFSWRSAESRIAADADWMRGGDWTLNSRAERVRLSLLQSKLPPGVQLAGALDGSMNAHGDSKLALGDARLGV